MMTQHGDISGTACAILMPAYNEEEALPNVIDEWLQVAQSIDGTLIIINDGSRDGTLRVLLDAVDTHQRLVVLDKQNTGHGPSCLSGYRWACDNDFDWMFQTDSDGQTRSAEFMRVWDRRNQHDFVFGFRPKRGDGLARFMISRLLRAAVLLTMGVYVQDANVPFRLMRAKSVERFLPEIPDDFFLANVLLAAIVQKYGDGVDWVPISFAPRTGGVPSVRFGRFATIGASLIKDLWGIRRKLATRFTVDGK